MRACYCPSVASSVQSSIDLVSANITSLGARVDSRSTISGGFPYRSIDQNDCLMSTIIAMGEVSPRSFTRVLDPIFR